MADTSFTRRHVLSLAALGAGVSLLPRRVWAAPHVTFGVASLDASYAFIYAALKKGYFAEAGLDVEHLNSQSGPRTKQMLSAGQVFAACTGSSDAVALTMAGKPSVLVCSLERRPALANILVSKAAYDAGVRSVKDLAGKKIGVTQPQSLTWLLGVAITEAAGLKGKVDFRPLGDFTTMLGAVKAGSVDGCIASFAMLDAAEAEGWGVPIFRSYDSAEWNASFKGDLPGVGVYVLKDTLEEKRAEVQMLVNGLVKGTDYVKSASPEDVAELVKSDFLPGASLPALVEAVKKFKTTWNFENTYTPEAYANLMSLMGDGRMYPSADLAARAKFADQVDNSFVLKARGKA
ncbi:ABC transporter substrate-binding protein [Roseixanthobacter glucoisosaccharinicivorans]|uniref:ABC transporter substrate-binding protein n=1 Tax=Roseixanthobacter glucoisosaccharinicivorans TaxID=3119923 RepID=UPI00372C9586